MKQREIEGTCALHQLLAFTLGGRFFALRLEVVDRIVRMVEVTPLPKAPEMVVGLINLQGAIIPVLNVRKRFALHETEPDWNDKLIIAHSARRTLSLAVDSVIGVIERQTYEIASPDSIIPGIGYVAGVVTLDGNLLFIHNLDHFLAPEEENCLDDAMVGN